ncbi:MAG: biotin/lipoyl-containing protein, partial [Cellulosimicrobium funkei]|uniref:biotin/lipoyl-containing protein n=1 Tax=Cellulosimicrobium funkei TaxID=264251 RepID=UPI003F9E9053
MSENVQMPALGESVTEGTVTRWLKSVGDTVAVDEPLLEVSTDKVDTEIPSPVAGTLEQILVQEDETVEVGANLAVIGDGSGGGGSAPAPAEAETEAPAPQAAPEPEQPAAQEAPAAPAPAEQPAPSGDSAGGGEEIKLPALGAAVTAG